MTGLYQDPALALPIEHEDDLYAVFVGAEKPQSEHRIGAEMEKPGVDRVTGASLPYDGEKSVVTVMKSLIRDHGWAADFEHEGGPLIAITRGRASITLEPGAQLELSGAAFADIHQVCQELRSHLREVAPVSKDLGVAWLGLGFHPFARREDLPWVPKDRYAIMREYLPTRGGHALDMMLRTSTVQANYDFATENDAMKKMRVAMRLAPLTTAMFANSPWKERARHGGVSYRARVWLDMDPDRSGLVPPIWKADAGYADYVAWALDVPMFLFKREGKVVANTGQTFRSFWKDGFQGHKPTQADWQTHINTLFPDVRLKKTIEIRGADAQGTQVACALPALWTGVFYDAQALEAADAWTSDWTYDEVLALRGRVGTEGLRTTFRDTTLQAQALELLRLSEEGLARRARKSAKGNDERVHLAPLRALVEAGKTPAEQALEDVGDASGDAWVRKVIEVCDLEQGTLSAR